MRNSRIYTQKAGKNQRRSVQGSVTTDYVLDGQSVVRTFRNGTVDRTWLHGPRGPEYERDAAGNVVWYLYDGLGSVLGTVDAAGNLVSTRKYDVYGAVRASTGPAGPKHRFVGALGHPGEEETGLIYMRARHYDPLTGRFISEDPARDGNNWFAYVESRPTCSADPDGKKGITAEAWFATMLLLAGIIAGGAALAWAGGVEFMQGMSQYLSGVPLLNQLGFTHMVKGGIKVAGGLGIILAAAYLEAVRNLLPEGQPGAEA